MAESTRERKKSCYSVFRTSYYYNFVFPTSLWRRRGGVRGATTPRCSANPASSAETRARRGVGGWEAFGETALCGSPGMAARTLSLRPRSGLVIGSTGKSWPGVRDRRHPAPGQAPDRQTARNPAGGPLRGRGVSQRRRTSWRPGLDPNTGRGRSGPAHRPPGSGPGPKLPPHTLTAAHRWKLRPRL